MLLEVALDVPLSGSERVPQFSSFLKRLNYPSRQKLQSAADHAVGKFRDCSSKSLGFNTVDRSPERTLRGDPPQVSFDSV